MKLVVNGPQTPALIQSIQAITNPLKYLEAAQDQYGDPFTIRWHGFTPIVIFSNPQAIQEIFSANPNQLHAQGSKLLKPLLGDNSLLWMNGYRHQQQRQLLTPPFHGERMLTYGNLICDIASSVMNEWKSGNTGTLHSYMQEISLQVITQVVFGINEGDRFQKIKQLLSSLLNDFNYFGSTVLFFPFLQKNLGSWSPWGRFLHRKQQIDELLYTEIQERQQQPKSSCEDILSLMISARYEDGQPMTNAELRDELMTLLFAGHETTATALTWALYWIHRLPDVKNRLLEEIEHLSSNPEPSEIAKLPYLTAVCNETLRLYPVVLFPITRIVQSPIEIMGYKFDAGTALAPCIYLTHHRKDIYPEPKRFQPERFLESKFSSYEFLPFGGGNRRCVGVALALFEMKLVLATILSRFQLALANDRPVKPIRRGIALTPAGGVQMVVVSQHDRAELDSY